MKNKSVSAVMRMPLDDGGYTIAIRAPKSNSLDLRLMKMSLLTAIKRMAQDMIREDDLILDNLTFKHLDNAEIRKASPDHWFFLSLEDYDCAFDLEPLDYNELQVHAKDIYLNMVTAYMDLST